MHFWKSCVQPYNCQNSMFLYSAPENNNNINNNNISNWKVSINTIKKNFSTASYGKVYRICHWSKKFLYFKKMNYCRHRDFTQKAKCRRGTLLTCAYVKESTYSWNIQSYSQYRKNLDLLEQGPRGIGTQVWNG